MLWAASSRHGCQTCSDARAFTFFFTPRIGAKYMGGIYGWILLAWGAGAIPSPILIARLRQTTGRYDQAILAIAVVMFVAMMRPLIVRPPSPPRPLRYDPGSMPP